jgi:protein-S-isoprenylcysteine O-methyltransferase Ste14
MERHRRSTERRLAVGGCLLLVLVGGGSIGVLYGRTAASVGVAVVVLVAGLGVLVWFILTLLTWWAESGEGQ